MLFRRRAGGVTAPGGLLVGPAPEANPPLTPPAPELTPVEQEREAERLRLLLGRTVPPPVRGGYPSFWCRWCGIHRTESETAPCPVCAADAYALPPDRRGAPQ